MGRVAHTDGLTEFEQDILATVRDFTNREIIPVATELEHRDEYPAQIVEGMRKLDLFGLTIPEAYGGLGASLLIYALTVEEIARGWMSVSGIIRRRPGRLLHVRARPGLRRRGHPHRAERDGEDFVLNGQKMWLTNGGTANLWRCSATPMTGTRPRTGT